MKSIKFPFVLFCNLIFILLFGCNTQPKKYTITGNISGAGDSMVVYLRANGERNINLDSTAIKEGSFTFTGKVDYPQLYQIIIHKNDTPANPRMPVYQPVIPVFVENSEIEVSAVLDSIPLQSYSYYGSYDYDDVTIKGSTANQTYRKFLEGYAPLANARGDIFMDEYIPYLNPDEGDTVGPVSEGIAIVTRIDEATEKRDEYVKDFIRSNSSDYVALFVAGDKLSSFSVNEIDEILATLSPEIMNTGAGEKLKEKAAEVKKTATGAQYADFTFKDNQGNTVKLSDHLGKGKYVLLEFWASWCGPCRADIPHLKKVYELYHPAGFEVISISMDENKEDWLKAIDEEQMPWLQVSDLKAFDGPLSKLYNFNGIPTCVLISPDGKIVTRNMRGSWMDKRLIEMYGNQFHETTM